VDTEAQKRDERCPTSMLQSKFMVEERLEPRTLTTSSGLFFAHCRTLSLIMGKRQIPHMYITQLQGQWRSCSWRRPEGHAVRAHSRKQSVSGGNRVCFTEEVGRLEVGSENYQEEAQRGHFRVNKQHPLGI
jgi:hypothetical protein